jgi:hypothetical protein
MLLLVLGSAYFLHHGLAWCSGLYGFLGTRFVSRSADAAAISEADEHCTATRTITHPLDTIVRVEIWKVLCPPRLPMLGT